MRILHVISGMAKAAGTSVFCGEVLRQLASMGHDCRLLVKRRSDDFYPVGERVRVFVGRMGAVSADGWRPEAVHIHALWDPWLMVAFLWARARRIPVVWSPHGMLAPWAMAHKRWKKVLPWWLYQRQGLRGASLLHVTSGQEAAWVRALGFKNKLVEVPLGTMPPSEIPKASERRHIVLFVGRIYPVKGLDLLIRAWARLKQTGKNQDWHLVCVGPDQAGHMGELERLARDNGLVAKRTGIGRFGKADIIFTGPLYGSDKACAYRLARLLVLPSYTENFGGVVPDALGFCLPVLASMATPWACLRQWGCGDSFAVTEAALEGALERFFALSDSELDAMGLQGRSFVLKRYVWPMVGKGMERAYWEMSASEAGKGRES